MRILESHIHMYARTTDDYERMKERGIEIVIEPAFWSGTDRSCAGTFFDYFNHILNFECNRARKHGISHYSLVGVNAKEARNVEIANEVIDGIERYLEHPRCIGIGEIGLDLNTKEEQDVFRQHVKIAEKHSVPVVIHLPHTNKRVGAETIIGILKEENVEFSRYIMDHNTDESIELAMNTEGMLAGITIYPTKMDDELSAELIKEYGADRIVLDSSADWGKSYPCQLADTAENLPKLGISEEDVKKVVFKNAYDFYSRFEKFQD